jgi:hypothetical protein
MEIRWEGRRTTQRSYVSEMLDVANGTARRITAICGLRYADLGLEMTDNAPHGNIRFPKEPDKEGREWRCAMTPSVQAAVDRILRKRPGIGAALLFPSPIKRSVPVSKDLASEWLLAAEKLAGLPKLEGGVWYPYRRKWATGQKHHPLKDVAATGGWKSEETLLRCYQQPDEVTMLNVVMDGTVLRRSTA